MAARRARAATALRRVARDVKFLPSTPEVPKKIDEKAATFAGQQSPPILASP